MTGWMKCSSGVGWRDGWRDGFRGSFCLPLLYVICTHLVLKNGIFVIFRNNLNWILVKKIYHSIHQLGCFVNPRLRKRQSPLTIHELLLLLFPSFFFFFFFSFWLLAFQPKQAAFWCACMQWKIKGEWGHMFVCAVLHPFLLHRLNFQLTTKMHKLLTLGARLNQQLP